MNQTTNLVQWKNLTDDVKAEHDFENYAYICQVGMKWVTLSNDMIPMPCDVYRLKIEPEKFYVVGNMSYTGTVQGHTIKDEYYTTIRPAKPSEIPEQEPSLEDRVKAEYGGYEVVMLEWEGDFWCLSSNGILHTSAQSMRNFAGYVYDCPDEITGKPFMMMFPPVRKNIHPCAVLFEAAK